MHFFVDPDQLPTQTAAEAYGPLVANPTSEFRLTSQFTLLASRKAYACQAGQLLVVETSDTNRVTLVLKPVGGLDVGLGAIRYYVYRGVQKTSFITGSSLNARQPTSGNSDALNAFWRAFDAYKDASNQPNLPDPLPSELVIASSVNNQLVSDYFAGQTAVRVLDVKEGDSLGNFGASTIGFEIITDTYGLTLDLNYFRQASYSILKTSLDALSGLAQSAARDAILSFIDPAAFFGLHTEAGVSFGSSKQPMTGSDVVTKAVMPFAPTAHRAYLDIRNEYGRSYNFSGSYGDASGHDIGLDGAFITYTIEGWPLHYVDLSAASGTTLQLQLRRDANTTPELFCLSGRYGGVNSPLEPCFAPATDLAELNNNWTHVLPFYLPGTKATYLKLHYYRPGLLANAPAGVLPRLHRLDNLFDLSHLPVAATATMPVQHAYAPAPVLVTGQVLNSTAAYTYVATNGAYASSDRAVCYLQESHAPKNPDRTDFYPPNANGADSPGLFSDVRAGFLRTQVALTATPLTAAGGTPIVQVADIYAYSGMPSYRESLTLLCLTSAEFQALANASGISRLHPRYLTFTDATPSGGLTDDTGEVCTQYQIQVQGFDNTGQRVVATPTPQVVVYTSANSFVLASPGLASNLASKPTISYQLDAEELAGNLDFDKPAAGTNPVSVMNYYTGTVPQTGSPIDTQVSTIVANFKLAIRPANLTVAQLTPIVQNAGRALLQRSITYIKEGVPATASHPPDDRSLYWGRIKMGIALKQLPQFANVANLEAVTGKANGNVKTGSPLSKLVQRFEESSRNYTNVSFNSATSNQKKILITGYDPFLINDAFQTRFNRYQLNPSDIVVSALHNEVIANGKALVQAMIFPVRYRDFDGSLDQIGASGRGVVERYIRKYITGSEKVDMIVTISQGRAGFYDVEQYATATRSGYFDNTQRTLPHNPKYTTRAIPLVTANKETWEWLETMLPSGGPIATAHQDYALRYAQNNGIITYTAPNPPAAAQPFPDVVTEVGPLPAGTLHTKQMLEGSGGAYLSNEIFYRVARMRYLLTNNTMKTGHLHIPVIPYIGNGKRPSDVNSKGAKSNFNFNELRNVIQNVRTIIEYMVNNP